MSALTAVRKGPVPRPAIDRLLEKSAEVDGCWLIEKGLSRNGYTQISVGSSTKIVGHRVAYEFFIGEIPAELRGHRLDEVGVLTRLRGGWTVRICEGCYRENNRKERAA